MSRTAAEVITEQDVRTYKYGGCGSLALAIHEATGWPIVAAVADDGLELHYAATRPDGRLVDITGAHTEDDMLLEYEFHADGGAVTLVDVTPDHVRTTSQWYGNPINMGAARRLVPAVLALGRAGTSRHGGTR
ncbi:hypothetical protein [Streptomyces sp. 4R-3d]|uniref:hypothetical protein n=1 Tax=Streptomyces sp. 4R-3d TaxID=2559605 RepID=UPI0010719F74|nr:hypothetical protein [Streptomyces sp. 4R-3d]TFI30152.1 hypothetical protein E4P36_05220 [Streptomyces sp. 4R-3d]